MADFDRESMLDMFIFEMNQLVEQLELNIIKGESGFSMEEINDIFRIMHTVKGSAAMMMFDSISNTAHFMEDLFFYLREEAPSDVDYSRLASLILEGMDFIKEELDKIAANGECDGNSDSITKEIKEFLADLKGEGKAAVVESSKDVSVNKPMPTTNNSGSSGKTYSVKIFFNHNCEMENIRCFTLLKNLEGSIDNVSHTPQDIIDESSINAIRDSGFIFRFNSELSKDKLKNIIDQTPFIRTVEIMERGEEDVKTINKFVGYNDRYSIFMRFDSQTEMQNVRAYAMIQNIGDEILVVNHNPDNLMDEATADIIKENGFEFEVTTNLKEEDLRAKLNTVPFIEEINIIKLSVEEKALEVTKVEEKAEVVINNTNNSESTAKESEKTNETKAPAKKANVQHIISVNVSKLDQLVNFMGELVIAEAMVTQNPELDGVQLDSFHKETRQLRKIINNLQDTVMSMRMVPLSPTFFKMNRLIRDMCKQLNKEVELNVIGDDTEVDKNIIEHIADPLMHIIRNSVDHGIEMPNIRKEKGKRESGTVTLEAKNSGGDVLIIIKDDGAGLKSKAILDKAYNNGLLKKDKEEYTEKEIQQFIFLPGFSTNKNVTSYSGRGVGMDVVVTNLDAVGGTVLVDSIEGEGTTFTLKIPLTLAIIDGMLIEIGGEKYTLPIIAIKQSFKCKSEDVFIDPDGNEMISLRGEVYNVIRLYEFFSLETNVTNIEDGIMILLENGDRTVCVFADDLIGEQQVVVKTMPKFINKINGISGCTLIGNGDISLIIDVAGIFDK